MRFFTSFRMTIFHFKVIATQPLDWGIRKGSGCPIKPALAVSKRGNCGHDAKIKLHAPLLMTVLVTPTTEEG
jgi:hypothetical protein